MSEEAVQVNARKIVLRDVDKLTPNPRNPKQHPEEQVAMLVAAIREFGFNVPILLDEDGSILAGHGRVEAAKRLGMKKVPTIEVGHLTEDQKLAFIVADNKLVERGTWDDTKLGEIVMQLRDGGMDLDLLAVEPNILHDMLQRDRTGFLDGAIEGDGEPRHRERTTVAEFVQLNFTMTADQRKAVMNVLRREMQRRGLNTSGEALVALCEEMAGDGEQD